MSLTITAPLSDSTVFALHNGTAKLTKAATKPLQEICLEVQIISSL